MDRPLFTARRRQNTKPKNMKNVIAQNGPDGLQMDHSVNSYRSSNPMIAKKKKIFICFMLTSTFIIVAMAFFGSVEGQRIRLNLSFSFPTTNSMEESSKIGTISTAVKDDRLVAVDASIAGSLDAGAEGFLSAGFNDDEWKDGEGEEADMGASSTEKEKRSRPRRHHHHHHRHNHVSGYRNPQLSQIQKEHIKQREAEIEKPVVVVIKRRIPSTTTTFAPRPTIIPTTATLSLQPKDGEATTTAVTLNVEEVSSLNTMISDANNDVPDDEEPQPQQQNMNGSLTIAGNMAVVTLAAAFLVFVSSSFIDD